LNITEVRVKLMRNRSDRLRAFCSITIDDDFVVHDLRVIEGRKGFFVAMPSRKLTDNCPRCGGKNQLRSKFCSECGARLDNGRQKSVKRDKVHVDVAHPINTEFREALQQRVLAAYEEEVAKGAEAAVIESDEDYYAGDEYEPAPAAVDEDYYDEVEQVVEKEAEESQEPELMVDREAEEGEEEGAPFALESPDMDILEKDEDVTGILVDALAEEEPFIEEVEEAVSTPEPAPEPDLPPPVTEQPTQSQEPEEAEEEQERGPEPGRVRRRTRREKPGGGFGDGIF